MDLNASPEPEEDDEIFEPQSLDDNINVHFHQINRSELGESGAEIARREREERSQRLRTQRNDDPVQYASQPSVYGDAVQPKRQKTMSRLPPGWLDCPGYGQDIGLIIPSKVPLGEAFNDAIPPGKRYSFKQVINKQRVMGKKLGLVIDLTNTNRYYSLQELRKDAIKHVKIACKGRDSVPDNESVNNFVYEVSQFLMRQKHARKYILVHCTHGHNRTGYMIVHYLMRTSSMSVTQAIKTFADARPPGIYKPDYIDGLYAFYHEKKPEMVVCPETPKWKTTELDLNGDAMPDDDDDGTSAALPLVNTETNIILTNDDTLGDVIPLEQQETMRQFVYQSLKLPAAGGKGFSVFPGSHPVSLDSENVKLLRQRYYYATWKADGTRYMMLITMDGCYLIDRHFTFRRVQMRFPCRTNEGIAERTHHYTLLDGEMVIDTVPDSRKQERRYLIYDMMAINSISIVERPFYERWKMLEKEIIEPRNYERQHIYQSRNPYYRYELEPFRVRRKDFWLLSTVTRLLKEFIPRLSHEADGLIFQGWDDPYVPRTHAGLLKWKYASMNSVDFLFEVDENREHLYLLDRGRKKLMEGNTVVFEDGADPQTYDKKIIECTSEANRVWKFMRVRVDKSSPNEMNTYRKVLKSINDNITEEILLAEISETIQLPMYADRIQRDSKPHSARRR